jgi:hypothetical protein
LIKLIFGEAEVTFCLFIFSLFFCLFLALSLHGFAEPCLCLKHIWIVFFVPLDFVALFRN